MTTDRKVIPMSERLQIVCFLIWRSNVVSLVKLLFLSEIIYGAKPNISRLVNSRKKYDFCSSLLKISNYSVTNKKVKKDIVDSLILLQGKGYISITGTNIKIKRQFDGLVNLSFLPENLIEKLYPFVKMSDESFLEEVLKYAKNY